MSNALLVGLGGFLGSLLRYVLGGWVLRLKLGWTFPLETLIINVLGCLVFGVLAGLAESRGVLSGSARAFLFIGLLGGFTTFSSFSYETFQLLRVGQGTMAKTSLAPAVLVSRAFHALGSLKAGYALPETLLRRHLGDAMSTRETALRVARAGPASADWRARPSCAGSRATAPAAASIPRGSSGSPRTCRSSSSSSIRARRSRLSCPSSRARSAMASRPSKSQRAVLPGGQPQA